MALLIALYALLLYVSPFSSTSTIYIDGAPAVVYVADNVAKWSIGYMNVSSYDPRGVGAVGMLFLFPTNSTYCFWMKNTRLPLKMVWISGDTATTWALGTPYSTTPICGYGDKVLEVRTDVQTPKTIKIGEQRPLH
ncbi:DUF192 domain-containing protein [Pyrobaculum aerophilum]|uniref:DUF192 domain-containing protein n=2 Tax=Pyrobaculum aerophilum TaxID=13773 RepID=Q8ZU43_PYRAE|nr:MULTISPECIES: DUF192 domain-containing protein [Pyrobaculum]AAL64565.1 conserved hypothetical protein [Pyrobaculum aerophilum str. IM2]MCX8136042.1 DUF192 domain-containing protein [Pyrobaculum aerophilum]HII47409.1 DUF192 domain-containing protein [Pyrobaculum aerophilum]